MGDLDFVFGSVSDKSRSPAKGQPKVYTVSPEPRNPPIMQLIERGYFNPRDAFNLAFLKLMIKRGFDSGVTWSGSTDSMHFDFVKGFTGINETECGQQLVPK